MDRGEIRDSTVLKLSEKVASGNYGQYLKRIVLKKVRGFTDREVSFDFPVTALVGPNGGGKTTVLGAAAVAYRAIQPGRFFAKSGKYDSSMVDWSIEHHVIDKSIDRNLEIRRSVNFPSSKWNRKPFERHVVLLGVTRTVPAAERADLRKAVGGSFEAKREARLADVVTEEVQHILGKSVQGVRELYVDREGKATLYAAIDRPTGNEYSEFHFGAGEASVIKIVSAVEQAPDNALILIEEIENGLHPVATRRLVEYLVRVAERKSAQVVFTSHSEAALSPLPSKAIWAAHDGELVQGALNIAALRSITGKIEAELVVFTEDEFATEMLRSALRSQDVNLSRVAIYGMGGHGPALALHKHHNLDPTRSTDSMAFVDGDMQALADPTQRIFVLPGDDDPEAVVFDVVHEHIAEVANRLSVALGLTPEKQKRVEEVVRGRALTNTDRHTIYTQIGNDLDFLSEAIVRNAFLSTWTFLQPRTVVELIEPIHTALAPN